MIRAGREAYQAAQMVRRVQNALGPQPIETLDMVLRDLARATGGGPARDPAELDRQFAMLHLAQAERAAGELRIAAAALGRPHQPTQRALSQMLMAVAEGHSASGERESAALAAQEAEQAALAGARAADNASAWAWLAVVRDHTADLLGDPAHRGGAIEALRRAVEFNPHSATLAWRLFAALDAARSAEATGWARRALELDAQASLDPEGAGLTESQREQAHRAVGSP